MLLMSIKAVVSRDRIYRSVVKGKGSKEMKQNLIKMAYSSVAIRFNYWRLNFDVTDIIK